MGIFCEQKIFGLREKLNRNPTCITHPLVVDIEGFKRKQKGIVKEFVVFK